MVFNGVFLLFFLLIDSPHSVLLYAKELHKHPVQHFFLCFTRTENHTGLQQDKGVFLQKAKTLPVTSLTQKHTLAEYETVCLSVRSSHIRSVWEISAGISTLPPSYLHLAIL